MDKVFENKSTELPNISHELKREIEMSAHLVKNLNDLILNFWVIADNNTTREILNYFRKQFNLGIEDVIEIEMKKIGDVDDQLVQLKDEIINKNSDIVIVVVKEFQKALEVLYSQNYKGRETDFNMMINRAGHDHDQDLNEDVEREERGLYKLLGKDLKEQNKRIIIVTLIDKNYTNEIFVRAGIKAAHGSQFKKGVFEA